MTVVVTRVALLCAVFLCALEERAQSQRARCDGTSCFVLHREPQDFAGAQRGCKGSTLLALSLREAKRTLPNLMRGSSGRYWLELRSDSTGSPMEEEAAAAAAAAAGLQRCYTVSTSGPDSVTVSQEQCRDKQDGFLCYVKLQNPCIRPLTTSDMQVIFKTEHLGLELMEWNFFPEGTIAVVAKVDAKYPKTKHVCFSGGWLQAPWTCEVLQGGCDHSCSNTTHTCTCPAGQTLHANNIGCTIPSKPQEGDSNASVCARGYALAQDGKSCVDVDECKDGDLCIREGEECLNTDGGYECTCRDGYDKEDGECVDFSICDQCEHMLCEKSNGVYACECRMGYRVSPQNPTKCLRLCKEEECLAECIYGKNEDKKAMNCFCPSGYITDTRNETVFCTDIDECETGDCDHECENFFGGYTCSCNEGFELQGKGRCVRAKEEEDKEEEEKEDKEEEEKEDKDKEEEKEDKEEDEKEDKDKEEEKEDKDKEEGEYGSGSPPPRPTPASSHPAVLPTYIKTGSVLGITVFLVLCAALLCLVVRIMVRRCGSFELPSFRPPDIDVFYLQQVTTETYKRLSFDKQFKNDLPRL